MKVTFPELTYYAIDAIDAIRYVATKAVIAEHMNDIGAIKIIK